MAVCKPRHRGLSAGHFENQHFAEGTLNLSPGDRLFLFTDGIEVVFNGEQIIDSQQWGEELQRHRHMTTPAMLEHFSNQMEQSLGSLAPKDDLTIIVVEMQG